jgi:transmembrane sensor
MNTNVPGSNENENRQILEEASAWFVEFRVGQGDVSTHRKFAQWLRRSPEHIRAYMEISGTYARLPTAKSVENAEIRRLIVHARSRDNVVTLDASLPAEQQPLPNLVGQTQRRTALIAGIAATLVLAILGVVFLLNHAPTYETQTGEQRTLTLEDGSRIELNARSKVRVAFSRTTRNVELIDGQAFFKVAKDAYRPFVVNSGGALVRAVGTQFDVYRKETGTTVTVLEGRVSLQSPSSPEPVQDVSGEGIQDVSRRRAARSFELSAGEQAVITIAAISKSRRANVIATTAWTQGQLEFDETPLRDAAVEFNRYSRKPLLIESPSLADLPISGVYASTDTASLLLFLRSQPDLVVTETDKEIRLTRR